MTPARRCCSTCMARWNLTGSVTRIERWRKLGFHVLAIDYCGFGKSTDAPRRVLSTRMRRPPQLPRVQEPARARYIVGHSLATPSPRNRLRRPGRRAWCSGHVHLHPRHGRAHRVARAPSGAHPHGEFDTLPGAEDPPAAAGGARRRVVPYRWASGTRPPPAKRFINWKAAANPRLWQATGTGGPRALPAVPHARVSA
jgi:hypothetical protein